MPTPPDEDDRARKYDPAVVAALARDDITLTEIARVVGIEYRSARDWASVGTAASERRQAYRALEAWSEGRAIAKPAPETLSGWVLESVRIDVSPAELAVLKRRVEEAVASLAEVSASLSVTPGHAAGGHAGSDALVTPSPAAGYEKSDPGQQKKRDTPLTARSDFIILGAMINPNVIRFASDDFEKSIEGVRMENTSIKLPDGFKEELGEIANEYGLTWAQLVRALAHMLRKGRASAAG